MDSRDVDKRVDELAISDFYAEVNAARREGESLTLADLRRIMARAREQRESQEQVEKAARIQQGAQPGSDPSQWETEQDLAPMVYLTSWPQILRALGMKNTQESRAIVRRLHNVRESPILFGGQSRPPTVEKSSLFRWWDGIEARLDETRARPAQSRNRPEPA